MEMGSLVCSLARVLGSRLGVLGSGTLMPSIYFRLVRRDADDKGNGIYGCHSDVRDIPPDDFCSEWNSKLRLRTRINWYLATVNSQLVYYTGEQQLADNLTDGTPPPYLHLIEYANQPAFIFLLPLGGLISTPPPHLASMTGFS